MAARPWSMPRCCAHDGAASSWRLLARELRGAVKSVCARSAQQATFSLAPVYFQGTWHRISASLRDFRATFGVAALLHRWWRSRRLFEKNTFGFNYNFKTPVTFPLAAPWCLMRTGRRAFAGGALPSRPDRNLERSIAKHTPHKRSTDNAMLLRSLIRSTASSHVCSQLLHGSARDRHNGPRHKRLHGRPKDLLPDGPSEARGPCL